MVLRRIGILGGTFDPPHRGHLEIARLALDAAALEQVIFIPAAQPRLKANEPRANPQQRLEMLQLAVNGAPNFAVSDLELRRPGPTLTVETLRQLHQQTPNAELHFILGLDALAKFDQWVEPQRITQLTRLLAVSRPGYANFDWPAFYARNPHAAGRIDCLPHAAINLSASELRRLLAAGRPVTGLLPAAVEGYIRENGLYRASGAV